MKSVYEEVVLKNQRFFDEIHNLDVTVKTVGDIFDETTEKWQQNNALIFYGNKISYRELRDKVDRLANGLFSLGIKKGDRIAFLLLNCPEYFISYFAAAKLGAVITPVSPIYVSSEIKHQLTDSGAKSIICQDFLYEVVEKTGLNLENIILSNISESLPKIKKLMAKSILRGVYEKMAVPSPEIFEREDIYQLQDLIRRNPTNPPKVDINPKKDLLVLPYTGGTTGKPKGVMITHENAIMNFCQLTACLPQLEDGNETLISYMPYYHAAGQLASVFHALLHGYTQVIITTPDIDDIINSIITYKATYFVGSPALYEVLKNHEKTGRVKWKKLKAIMSGADALHEVTARDWEARTGANISEAYGMTEITALSHFNPIGKEKYGSIGIPIPHTIAAILDPDEDKYCPVGEIGEIAIIGPQVTIGYWNNSKTTKDCIADLDGKKWWRTGDLGRMEEDGYFYIYDRKRDLIKYKGLRIFAREVEDVLKEHPQIKEASAIGVKDIKVGENVKAFVVLESDARGKVSEKDIMEYCEGKMAHYKIPRIVEFVGEIPKTDIGKVSRRELREEE
jgi:long-chain acyl-CoA synthetase